ncbi:DMT family transporter [Legionella jordanis]|nr:DMT family transporter [Legionella jordanis]RMX22291.1 DMT family transporter [Legionella jordanis]HAT8712856.1 EamA family transporter [Legionella jordanis]
MLLTALGCIWGSGYVLAKYAIMNGVPPLGYAFWQSCGPAILLSCFCLLFNKQQSVMKRTHWPYFLVCGLIGIAIPNSNMYFVANHLSAGLLAVLVNTVPLLVYPLALIARQEQFDPLRASALVFGMSGILMIINPPIQGLTSPWCLLALISPLGFALCSIYIAAKQPEGLNPIEGATGMLIASTLLLIPLVAQQHAFYSLTGTINGVKAVVILEILLSSLGYLLFFKLLTLAGPVFYSLTGGIVALTGLFWDYVIFGNFPDSTRSLASFLIIFAIFLISWRQRGSTEEAL